MKSNYTQHSADERLLDAALQQIFTDSPATSSGVEEPPQADRRSRWLQAAIFLLGLTITGVVLWQSRVASQREDAPTAAVTAQDPAQYGIAAQAQGRAEIEALPVDTTNLTCHVLTTGDLEVLKRLRSLRRLQVVAMNQSIGPVKLKTKDKSWREPAADVFKPLADLPALETLTLPMRVQLTAAHLTPLRGCLKLRELYLMGDQIPLTEEFVAGLERLPHLQSLRLDLVQLDAAVMTHLRKLSLEELELSRCPGFDGKAYAELCLMTSLRRLSMRDLGRREFGVKAGLPLLWKPSPDQLGRLAALPDLEHLAFHSCVFGVDELRALPDGLTSLDLQGHELLPDDFRELRRFGLLRHLQVRTGRYNITFMPRDTVDASLQAADAVAEALDVGGLRLQRLVFGGAVSTSLLRELAEQPDLEDVTLNALGLPSLAELGSARALRKLTLYETRSPSTLELERLRPLAACGSLRELVIGGTTELEAAEVAAAVGDKIAVTIRAFGK